LIKEVENIERYYETRVLASGSTLPYKAPAVHFGSRLPMCATVIDHDSSSAALQSTADMSTRWSLSRWTISLTVLLEKTWCSNRIHKMRPICLLEGDFNYYNKTNFAHRMLALAREKEQIPIKCFAKKGSNCINAIMTKKCPVMNYAPIIIPRILEGTILGDCYDRVAPPPASIALQSFGVPPPAIRVLFLAMQTMR
jgi:hypothetical protein